MRVVLFGYQTWGYRTLEALLGSEHEVVLAVTHPKSDHAYESIWSDSVADLAAAHGVPVVVLGPGSVAEQAHRADESVGVDELVTAARAYALAILRLGGADTPVRTDV